MFRQPKFCVRQDEDFLVIEAEAPYLRASDVRFYLGDREMRLLCPPYALQLSLPGEVDEDGREKAQYCPVTGSLVIHLPKRQRGIDFDLSNVADWVVPDALAGDDRASNEQAPTYHYGFNAQYSGVFRGLEQFEEEILESPEPETTSPIDRVELRTLAEDSKFDPDYYLGDLVHQEDFSHVFAFRPWWVANLRPPPPSLAPPPEPVTLTEQDSMVLARFGPKNFLLENEESEWCLLVDVLFAYVHHELSNVGEESCEASWNISRLSRCLSWLDVSIDSVRQSLIASYRRALAYPLYRSWALCECVRQHLVAILLGGGRSVVLKCVLRVYHAMTHNSEKRYLLNVVFINDLLSWVQACDERIFVQLGESVAAAVLRKDEVGLGLPRLEKMLEEDQAGAAEYDQFMEIDQDHVHDDHDADHRNTTSNPFFLP